MLVLDLQLPQDDLAQLVSTILIVLLRCFNEGEAIDVTHVRSILGSEHVKTADVLFESDSYLSC